jgi:cytochrome bd ubiquinol oxidase subunit II
LPHPPEPVNVTTRSSPTASAAGVDAFVGIFVVRDDARYIVDGLTARALPSVILSAVCGTASLVLLVRDAARAACVLAIVAVASNVAGWGVAQWPYILPTSLTVSDAAAPSGTLTTLIVATVLLLLIVIPGFTLLYTLDQKSVLPEESVD